MQKNPCFVPLALSLLVSATSIIFSRDASATDAVQELQSQTEAYAIGASNKPLLQGEVSKKIPFDWSGTWQGGVRLDHLNGRASNNVLQGEDVEMLLKMETPKEDKTVFDLQVRQLGGDVHRKQTNLQMTATVNGGKEDDPDIHYWHDKKVSHLDIKSGATMKTSGFMVIGDNPGEKTVVTISRGATLIIGDGSGARGDTNYNNQAIYTSGATEYQGRYFKSDERIAANEANIHANRIDIGNSSVYTDGRSVNLTGNSQAGMLLSQLNGGGTYLNPSQVSGIGPNQTVMLIKPDTQTQIFHIAPGVYDVKSTSNLIGSTGKYGTQYTSTRFTAFSADRIMVQTTIENFDLQSKLIDAFTTSGYLLRQ